MVKKSKPRKKPIESGITHAAGLYAGLSRVEWGERALKSRGNAIDHGKMAKNQKDATPGHFNAWSKGGHKKYDLDGFDHPRPDVKKIPKTHQKYAGAPKTKVSKIAKIAGTVLRNNFTAKERKDIGKVLIEGSPKSRKAAGSNTYYPSDKLNIVKIDSDYIGDEDVYTHELIHARRHGSKDRVIDRNREEKMTDFETVGRLSSPEKKEAGYYRYIKGESVRTGIKHDRILLTGSMAKRRKGKVYLADVKKKYDKSKIKDAHFSPAENLDRYFQVILPSGERVEVHRRYKPHKRDTKAQVLKQFKEQFGKDITAYEWENGKKVRIGHAVKRGSATPKPKARVKKRGLSTREHQLRGKHHVRKPL